MAKDTGTTVGTYPSDGPVVEMRGLQMAIPNTVKNKRAWMESQWREEKARLTADKEKQAREQQVLDDRIATQKQRESIDGQLNPIREQLVGLQEQLIGIEARLAKPDAAQVVEINANTTANMARTMDATEKTRELLEQVEALQTTVGGLRDEVEVLQAQTLQVNKNRLEFANESVAAQGEMIRQRDEQIRAEQEHAVALGTEINNNYQVVMAAKDVQKSTVEAARAEVNQVVTEMTDDFVGMVNLMLTSLGLTQGTLEANLNMVDVQPTTGVKLTREQIGKFAEVYRKASRAMEEVQS